MDSLEQSAADSSGYRVESHSVEFTGICPDCANGY
jgi:Fe2+ or Zn2+ uptake regulation protein